MTVLQAITQATKDYPTASIMAGVTSLLGGLWLILRAVGNAVVTRIIAGWDAFKAEVKADVSGMRASLEQHTREDMVAFRDVDAKAHLRQESLTNTLNTNANVATAVLTAIQIEFSAVKTEVTLMKEIVDRRLNQRPLE